MIALLNSLISSLPTTGALPASGMPAAQAPAGPAEQDPRAQLLAQLNDVLTPHAVGFWPPAPGWWLLGLAVLAVLGLALKILLARSRAKRYRTLALRELASIKAHASHQPASKTNQHILQLLKRVAFTAYPEQHAQIAQHYGDDWLKWLNERCKKQLQLDTQKPLGELLYGPTAKETGDLTGQLFTIAERWIKHHQPAGITRTNQSQSQTNSTLTYREAH